MISSDLWGTDQEMLLNEEQVTSHLCTSGEECSRVSLRIQIALLNSDGLLNTH